VPPKTPFDEAVLNGDLAVLRDELARGADPNRVVGKKRTRREPNRDIMPDGFTALHVAAYEDDVPLAELLIEHGADLHAKTPYGSTPLHLAAEWNSPRVARVLLARGADPARQTRALPPLVAAAARGHREVVRVLLEAGGKSGMDHALGTACSHLGDPEIVSLLLDAGASADPSEPDSDKWSPRVAAVYYRKLACLEILRARTEPITLMDACIDGNATVVRHFLAAGKDPNLLYTHRMTCLVAAARMGRKEAVELLVEAGADVNYDSILGRPIVCALERDHLSVADFLYRQGATLDLVLRDMSFRTCSDAAYGWVCQRHVPEEPDRLLARAAGNGDLPAMRAMLSKGADPNGREAWGRSALTLAVASNRVEAVRLLLDHGADPRATDRNGRPILHYVLVYDDVTDAWDDPDFDPKDYDRDSSLLEMEAVKIIRKAGARLPWDAA
jgi:ankyrin repeat protein